MCAGGVCRRGSVLEDSAGTEGDSQCTQTAGYEQRRWAKSEGLFWFWVKSGVTNVWKNIKEVQYTQDADQILTELNQAENKILWLPIHKIYAIRTKFMPFGINIGPAVERFCNCSTGLCWVVSFMCCESVPCMCREGCVGPRASIDTLGNRKFSCPCQVYNHDSLIDQPAVSALYGPCRPGF